jgi:hypothetical protein
LVSVAERVVDTLDFTRRAADLEAAWVDGEPADDAHRPTVSIVFVTSDSDKYAAALIGAARVRFGAHRAADFRP